MKKILGLLLLMQSIICSAQIEPQVNLVTGSPMFTIPLYTINERDLQFPISLTYIGNGVRLDQTSGWVGQNWSTSLEAKITREVRGIADDYLGTGTDTRKGWLRGDMGVRIKNYTFVDDGDPNTCSDEGVNWTFLNSFSGQDTEPDMFDVSVPGLSFQFFFDENGQPHVVPYQDVTISKTTDAMSGQINSFTITDDKGIKYLFQDIEHSTVGIQTTTLPQYFFNRRYSLGNLPYSYNTCWRLSSITSPTAGLLTFNYSETSVNNNLYGANRFNLPLKIWNSYHLNSMVLNYSNQFTYKTLQSIVASSERIDLSSFSTETSRRLNSIQISDTRNGTKLAREFDLDYISIIYYSDPQNEVIEGWRIFLTSILEKVPKNSTATLFEQRPPYLFEYNSVNPDGTSTLPFSDTRNKDAWNFFTGDVIAGTLKKMTYPLGGYSAFFYEPNQYFDNATASTISGGGVRLRKTIIHDGINSGADKITEYEYLEANGQTSGKLFYRPKTQESVLYADWLDPSPGSNLTFTNVYYRDIDQRVNNGTFSGPTSKYFSFNYDADIGAEDPLDVQSAVAYRRVTVKQATVGRTIFEYDLPAMNDDVSANSNEWQATKVSIARPSSGTCYEKISIPTGANQFPYPRNPNYNFARALLTKVSNVNEAGTTVKETSYEYQRLYAGSAIRKIIGLTFEDLQTYYYTASYVTARMFLYGRYEINTDVTTVLKTKTEKLYNGVDQGNALINVNSYYHESPNHRFLTKIIQSNSDQSQLVNKMKYLGDYSVADPIDIAAGGIAKLIADHRTSTVIESTSSVIKAGTEAYIGGALSTFQVLNFKAVPYRQYIFSAPDGVTSYSPSIIQTSSGTSAFQFDQNNYVLAKTYTAYDGYLNVSEAVGRDRVTSSIGWGYGGTVPVISVNNATLKEIAFSDFETTTDVSFSTISFTPTYTADRVGGNAINLQSGSNNKLTRTIVTNGSNTYVFSGWINSPSNGNVILNFTTSGTGLISSIQFPYSATNGWKYYSFTVNASSLPGSFIIEVLSSQTISLDDVAFYPFQASISTTTYNFPFGASSNTDTRGTTNYYFYDNWGRVKFVKDENQNIVTKYDYNIKP